MRIYCGWQLLKEVKYFKFHWCKFAYENKKKDIQKKIAKFSKALGILNNTFKPTWFRKVQE